VFLALKKNIAQKETGKNVTKTKQSQKKRRKVEMEARKHFLKAIGIVEEPSLDWETKRAKFCKKELEELIEIKNKEILVLGCGNGKECSVWKKTNLYRERNEITACDIDKKEIEKARENSDIDYLFYQNLEKKIDLTRITAGKNFLEKKIFDIIYCSEVLEHLHQIDTILSEANRLLKTNGFFVITTDNPCNLQNAFRTLNQNSWFYHVPGHVQFYSPKDLKKKLQENGFETIKIKTLGNLLLPELGENYLIIAKKTGMNE
jgi:2-polyprenyl-3-methyl-5-hydroxy-6-metoxy-1,4-benzoquinol methylase